MSGKKLDLRISQGDQTGAFPTWRLTGRFSGPVELLGLVVGAVAYFAP